MRFFDPNRVAFFATPRRASERRANAERTPTARRRATPRRERSRARWIRARVDATGIFIARKRSLANANANAKTP
jgi:hypothetical protein|tara:strand:+ start:532 stop:756 length:225 start_codon:yes stop_codon:yes gene_type:complete